MALSRVARLVLGHNKPALVSLTLILHPPTTSCDDVGRADSNAICNEKLLVASKESLVSKLPKDWCCKDVRCLLRPVVTC